MTVEQGITPEAVVCGGGAAGLSSAAMLQKLGVHYRIEYDTAPEFGAVVFYAATQTLIQDAVPDHLRGRVMGIWMVAFSGSVPLGSLWTGLVAHGWGADVAAWFEKLGATRSVLRQPFDPERGRPTFVARACAVPRSSGS